MISQALRDKNGEQWFKNPPVQRRCAAHDVPREVEGPTPQSKKNNILETLQLFLTVELLTKILQYSIAKLATLDLDEQYELTFPSLKAYIGIMYY